MCGQRSFNLSCTRVAKALTLSVVALTIGLFCFFYQTSSAQNQSLRSAAAATNDDAIDDDHDIRESMKSIENFVVDHCLDCHDSSSDDLNLEDFSFAPDQFATDGLDTSTWENILLRINSRQMPPPGNRRPDEKEYESFSESLSGVLQIHADRFPNPGRVGALRRMTRYEYSNAIRDLLGVQIDAQQYLPADPSSHGFDNITVEEMSPAALNRYLSAAQKISRIAIGGLGNGPRGVTIRLPADQSQEEHVPGLPFGTRGGMLLHHHFHRDGVYEIELKLTRDRDEKIEGLHREHEIDILLDRERMQRFTIAPPDKNSGDWEHQDFTNVDSHLKTRIHVAAGAHDVGITFPKITSSLVEDKRQPFDASYNRHRHPRRTPALYQVSITGPFSEDGPGDTLSRQLIFGDVQTDKDSGEAEARQILTGLARRAYRRSVTDQDLETPLEFFRSAAAEKGFEYGIEIALSSILVNPNFLFKIETDSPVAADKPHNRDLNPFELATRLSFFLWSSIPDEPLLDVAASGELLDPDVLREQTLRMLRDPRSTALSENFAGQWLYLRNLESITPDLRLYPDFDHNLRTAFRRETELWFEHILRNDLTVTSLIDSRFTYLNQRLADHYGISGVAGSEFRMVDVTGTHRGGILRHGSILLVTSYATRTSPTIRGSWILENLFGTPVPPPPPDIPNLKENSQADAESIRDRLALHRKNPACASCHDLIDPIGFSLENYDVVGRWREQDGGIMIDAGGLLPDGSQASSVVDLERSILKRPGEFVRTLTGKLFTYSIGRAAEPCDGPVIRKIVRQAAEKNFPMSEIISGIVLSEPFRKRRIE